MTNATTEKKQPIKTTALELLRLIEDFGNLLVRESDALKKADFRMVDMLQDDKKNYAKLYHAQVTALGNRRDEMTQLDLSMRERLVKARTTFTIILNENTRALEASKDSTRRLVDRILDTARKAVANEVQTNYSAQGYGTSYKTSTLSLRIDQNL